MENKDKSEQLLDLLLDLTEGAAIGLAYTDGPGKAYQIAGEVVCELEEAKARIKELEHVAATVVDVVALRDVLFDIIEWFDAGDIEAAREQVGRARRLLAGGGQ